MFNTVSVIGLGYIGLPTAAMFASKGLKVIGVDLNPKIVDTINKGEIHIIEPGLERIVKNAVDGGLLTANISPEPADAFLIAVPTPFMPVNKTTNIPSPDLSYVKSAAKAVAKVLKSGDLVVLESTSPVGATEKMAEWLAQERGDLTFPQTHGDKSDIKIAHCPERVLPGHVLQELVENDRVIGGMSNSCSQKAIELYKIFVRGDCFVTNSKTAEMSKLTENASRDVNIAFANELSIISDKLGIDVWELIKLANRHPRVNILKPGPGVGGHCIAVDPWFIVSKTPEISDLMHTARKINDSKPYWVIDKVKSAMFSYLSEYSQKSISDIKIACFGLSFKPDIDDLRESPALKIAQELSNLVTNNIFAVEPNIASLPSFIKEPIELVTISKALSEADIFIFLVNHSDFLSIDKSIFSKKLVIDVIGKLHDD